MMTTVTHFSFKDTHRPKVKERKKMFPASGKQKKVVLAILISDKTDFKPKKNFLDMNGNFYSDKMVLSTRIYYKSKFVCTQESFKMYRVKNDRAERRDRQIHIHNQRF